MSSQAFILATWLHESITYLLILFFFIENKARDGFTSKIKSLYMYERIAAITTFWGTIVRTPFYKGGMAKNGIFLKGVDHIA